MASPLLRAPYRQQQSAFVMFQVSNTFATDRGVLFAAMPNNHANPRGQADLHPACLRSASHLTAV